MKPMARARRGQRSSYWMLNRPLCSQVATAFSLLRCAAGKVVERQNRLLRDGVYGEADLSQLEVYSSFMIRWTDNVKVPFWSITFVRENPDSERSYTDEMLAFVDAKTGEVVWYRGMKD